MSRTKKAFIVALASLGLATAGSGAIVASHGGPAHTMASDQVHYFG